MTTSLSPTDYKKILKHYGLPIPKSKRVLQKKGEDIMARKLCSCIKKVSKKLKNKKNESAAIGICTFSVIKNRGLKYKGFTCKNKPKFKNGRNGRNGLTKRKTVRFKSKRKTRKRQLRRSSRLKK